MIVGTTSKSRRGMTTIAVVCLLITLISGALLKVGLAQRDANRERERRLQAEWLAESGVDRALARLTSITTTPARPADHRKGVGPCRKGPRSRSRPGRPIDRRPS